MRIASELALAPAERANLFYALLAQGPRLFQQCGKNVRSFRSRRPSGQTQRQAGRLDQPAFRRDLFTNERFARSFSLQATPKGRRDVLPLQTGQSRVDSGSL